MFNIKEEAKAFGIEQLTRTTGLSRSNIYEIINGRIKPRINTYEKLLNALGYKLSIEKIHKINIDTKDLKENLIIFGAPLYSENKKFKRLSLDKTLLHALEYGRFDTSINSILPYFINRNLKQVDLYKIRRLTSEKRYLGYLLNIILLIENNLELATHLEFLKDKSLNKKENLIKREKISKFHENAFSKSENICADEWGFQTLDHFDDIKARYINWSQET